MPRHYAFTDAQIDFLQTLMPGLDSARRLEDDAFFHLSDAVVEKLAKDGFTIDNEPTEIGLICEGILDILAEDE